MPLLATASWADRAATLSKLPPSRVRGNRAEVMLALASKYRLVRWEAVVALGRAGIGERELRQRLSKEKSEIVLAEVCDVLVNLGSTASLRVLRELASGHRSRIVRSYACLAVADLGGKKEIGFLQKRLAHDRSRKVQASLVCALLSLGQTGLLPRLEALLCRPEAAVRATIATLLTHYRPRRQRKVHVEMLQRTLESEERRGIRGDLLRAIAALTPRAAR